MFRHRLGIGPVRHLPSQPDQPSGICVQTTPIERKTAQWAFRRVTDPRGTGIGSRYDRREPVKYIRTRTLLIAGAIAVGAAIPAVAIDISGAGATFPYPIYAK